MNHSQFLRLRRQMLRPRSELILDNLASVGLNWRHERPSGPRGELQGRRAAARAVAVVEKGRKPLQRPQRLMAANCRAKCRLNYFPPLTTTVAAAEEKRRRFAALHYCCSTCLRFRTIGGCHRIRAGHVSVVAVLAAVPVLAAPACVSSGGSETRL